ncbi:MAG: GDSL-type esterase/lipase family protein [Intestinimonas sp.]|jgi:lysophospholipase L1-like esterase|nr:GDSL-type esterase/lipase family protein [Intestinimonas sp.]
MKLLCLGDSLTYGYGVSRRNTWVCLTAERTGHTLINCGLNGDTVVGMRERLPLEAEWERPDGVFVMGGTNDILITGGDAVARRDLADLVRQARKMEITPILGIAPEVRGDAENCFWPDREGLRTRIPIFEAYAAWQLRLARAEDIPVVDFRPAFAGRPTRELYLDGIHPNAAGHAEMADVLCRAQSEPTGMLGMF